MDAVRDLVRKRLAEKGFTDASASRLLKRNHAYLHQFLNQGKPKTLPEGVRAGLADLLDVQEWELRETGSVPSFKVPAGAKSLPAMDSRDQISVLGMAAGSEDGWSWWNGDEVASVPRPAVLAGVPKAYAVYAIGHSMEPRYYPNEMLFINPGKPAQNGHFVLIELHPKKGDAVPRAMVKQLVKRTPTKTVFHQFNPDRDFDIPNAEILHIHKIVGSSSD